MGPFLMMLTLVNIIIGLIKNSTMIIEVVLCVFVYLIYGIAAWVHIFYLSPLSDSSLRIPKFQHQYIDPQKIFSTLGPAGWKYSPILSAYDSGVKIQFQDRNQYMGVSEATVMIKTIDSNPKNREEIFKLILESQRNKDNKGQITINMEPAVLLDGEKGMWSIIEIRKLWFKFYQVSLIGLKDNSHLCIVSATGLKNHDTLAKILLQGLYRATKINKPKNKNIATN
ncbi:MAG: hypothetical protein ACKVQC_03070 [Elusimicrobiota bacterium]